MGLAGIIETTQYQILKPEGEIFALDISKVREVLDFTAITKVLRNPEFASGLNNSKDIVITLWKRL